MTVSVNDRRARYTATEDQTIFDIDFPLENVTYLRVYIDGDVLTADDYTVDIDDLTVTLDEGADAGQVITIEGRRTLERTTDFPLLGDLSSSTLNAQLDALYLLGQELRRDLDRAVVMNPAAADGATGVLPLGQANRLLMFDAAGENIITGPASTDVDIITDNIDTIDAVSDAIDEINAVAAIDDEVAALAALTSALTALGAITTAISGVHSNAANINAVAANLAGDDDIGTVADAIATVIAVGTNIAAVTAVNSNETNINIVAADLDGDDDIGTVAASMTDITSVAGNLTAISSVHSNATNINAVAAALTNINTLAALAAAIVALAPAAEDIQSLADFTLQINTQTGASYTLVLTDAAKYVRMNRATAQTLTVPANSTAAFPVGTQIIVRQAGAGQVTVAAAGGVTINSSLSLKLRAQHSTATLVKVGTNEWDLSGDLAEA